MPPLFATIPTPCLRCSLRRNSCSTGTATASSKLSANFGAHAKAEATTAPEVASEVATVVHRDVPFPVFVPARVPFSYGLASRFRSRSRPVFVPARVPFSYRYQSDTVPRVAMTLRLTDQEQAALRRCAEREG